MNQSPALNEQFLSTLISPKSLTFNQIHILYICKAAVSQFQRIKNSICFTVYIYFPPTERSFRFKIEMSGKISSKFELATLYNVLIGKVSSYNISQHIFCVWFVIEISKERFQEKNDNFLETLIYYQTQKTIFCV